MDTNEQNVLIGKAACELTRECCRLKLDQLDDEQVAALWDGEQCFAMLDDMEARCGMDVAEARALLVEAHTTPGELVEGGEGGAE